MWNLLGTWLPVENLLIIATAGWRDWHAMMEECYEDYLEEVETVPEFPHGDLEENFEEDDVRDAKA